MSRSSQKNALSLRLIWKQETKGNALSKQRTNCKRSYSGQKTLLFYKFLGFLTISYLLSSFMA